MTLTQLANDPASVSIDISDVVGRSIYSNTASFSNGRYSLDIGNVLPGVYLMQLTDAKGRKFMYKFVKE